jgi:hypothetical protein
VLCCGWEPELIAVGTELLPQLVLTKALAACRPGLPNLGVCTAVRSSIQKGCPTFPPHQNQAHKIHSLA